MSLSDSGFSIRQTLEGLSSDVRKQAEELEEMLAFEIHRLGVRDTDNLLDSLKTNVRFRDGVPESIGAKFARSGIFMAKGARRGHGGRKGSTWRTSKGEKRTTNPESKGKLLTGYPGKRDWISQPLDTTEKHLGSVLEKHYGEATIKVLKP
jgi:hypothetical protein